MSAGGVGRGAAEGALVWLAYAVVESAFTVLVPWFLLPATEYLQMNWGFTALLFPLYAAAGAVFGALGAAFWRGAPAGLGAMLALVAAFCADYGLAPEAGIRAIPFLVMAVGLGTALVLSAMPGIWTSLAFLRNPWTVAALLAGVPCVSRDVLSSSMSLAQKAAWTSVYIGFVLLASLLFSRRSARNTGEAARSFVGQAVWPVILSLAVLAACLVPQARPRILPARAAQPRIDAGRPNIILITLDTVRADHLSLYGYARATTPNLERFGSEAMVYRGAIAPADMTLPSHGSIFTGVYASRHGAHISPAFPTGRPLESPYPTLAEILRAKGYATAAVVANSGFLNQVFQMQRGFDYYDDRRPVSFFFDARGSWLRQVVVDEARRVDAANEWCGVYRDAHTITEEAYGVLDRIREERRPVFLFLNYMDAHSPLLPPAPFATKFPGKLASFTPGQYAEMKAEVMSGKRAITAAEKNHLISQYDGGIAFIDSELARLFARLRQLGMYDNSLIVVTADHGEAFGDRNLVEHGGVSVYQDEIGVPLLVRYPHGARRGSIDQPVSLVDVMPTAIETAGYDSPPGLDGGSLQAAASQKGRVIISESFASPELFQWSARFDRDERAIYAGPLKLIASTRGARELYDLSRDPNEIHNLYEADPATAKTLEAGLRQWAATTVRPGVPPGVHQYRLDVLKSLGYLQ